MLRGGGGGVPLINVAYLLYSMYMHVSIWRVYNKNKLVTVRKKLMLILLRDVKLVVLSLK